MFPHGLTSRYDEPGRPWKGVMGFVDSDGQRGDYVDVDDSN